MTVKFVAYMFDFYDEHPHLDSSGNPIKSNADGEVWYRVIDGERAHNFTQPFHKGDLITGGSGNVWAWDGDRENPTIRPSLLAPDYHFHCYVTRGKIELLSDSRVEDVATRMTWDEFMYGNKK